jgi:glycosyltransferase involved in cell wall biosynthesis
MTMKKLFWCIQQLDRFGGTETVSVQLMNLLCPYYDITLVCTSKLEGEVVYDLDPRLKVVYLDVPSEVGRFDQFWMEYGKKHQHKKRIHLLNQLLSAYVFHKGRYRKKLAEMMDDDSILIASSLDSYVLSPKKQKVFFHYHFDAPNFFSGAFQSELKIARKPDRWIFLSKAITEEITTKKPKLKDRSSFIYNPIKFDPVLDTEFHNNALIFVGRYTEQKNPLFALKIANVLHEKGFPFTLNMYGDGHLESAMRSYCETQGLSEVTIHTNTKVTQKQYLESDLLLLTSRYEGFVLVKGEANASSRPVLSTQWKGSIAEMFHEGKDGWVLDSLDPEDYANKIIEVLSDKEKLKEIKKNSYECSLALGKEAIVKEWRALLG